MKWVLFVDDDNLFRQVLALVLKSNTALKDIVEANSLAGARRVLGNSNHKPDLAIVDLDLGKEDGSN